MADHPVPIPVTFNASEIPFNSTIVTFNGLFPRKVLSPKRRYTRMEDYLGVGNALIHR